MSQFFKKISEINKPLANSSISHRVKIIIRNESGHIKADTEKIQRILRTYFKIYVLYCIKLENLKKKKNTFLNRYDLPKINQDQRSSLKIYIFPRDIEASIKSLPTQKSLRPDGFSREVYQTFKQELIIKLIKLFHRIETGRTLPNLFYEATVTLIPKPNRDPTKNITYCKQRLLFHSGHPDPNNHTETILITTLFGQQFGHISIQFLHLKLTISINLCITMRLYPPGNVLTSFSFSSYIMSS